MERELHSIGRLARASGLTISALRFYDRAGVLVPAVVDPQTGYRWYTEDQLRPARLVAGLRRVGMPLTQIATAARPDADPAAVRELLDAHLRRLESGLADARRELSRIRALLDDEENEMTRTTELRLAAPDLAAALTAVRFAVGADAELPQLASVLLDVGPAAVRLVTTDRYRLAFAELAAEVNGPQVQVMAPVGLIDRLRDRLGGDRAGVTGTVGCRVDGTALTFTVDGELLTGEVLPYDFPDYRRALRDQLHPVPARRVTVDVAALRASLIDTTPFTVSHEGATETSVVVLRFDGRGGVSVGTDPGGATPAGGTARLDGGALGEDAVEVGVNREYLLDALDAGDRGQLVLELDGPITPLAVRRADDEGTFSVLMPIRL